MSRVFTKYLRSFFPGSGRKSSMYDVPTTPSSFSYVACSPDPYPLYAEARLINSVCLDQTDGSWIILTYDRVVWALKSTELFSNQYSAAFDPFLAGSGGMAHAKIRKALTASISRFQAAAIATFTENWMDGFFRRIQGHAGFDAVADLAIPLPRDFTADLLGLSPEEKRRIVEALAPRRTDMNSALQPVGEVLLSVMESIRRQPRNGIISALMHSQAEEPLSSEEILATTRHLWFAGTVTLTGLIPAAILQLCRQMDIRKRLGIEPGKMLSFVSEVLRLEAPTQFVPRMAAREISIDGVTIPSRAMVRLGLGSANRDPAAFPNPNFLDLDRPPNRHLSFGMGEHFCLGAIIAKTIAATALQRIVNEYPEAGLGTREFGATYEKSPMFRGPVALPIVKR